MDAVENEGLEDDPVSGSSDRSFGLVFFAVFAGIGLWPLLNGGPVRPVFLVLAGVTLGIAGLRPSWLSPFNRRWIRLGGILGNIMSPGILGILYFCVVTPTGVFLRILGKDLLRMRRDPAAASYWIERDPPGPAPESLINQF
ncbi:MULTISPECIES: SxtJ family membrane protein [unclassified Nitrospina]|uniref:SxtJ family membrane protein n=1 Tax=unclassified Nitrospina TaxID=2638683 RepID=UPI003F9C9BED